MVEQRRSSSNDADVPHVRELIQRRIDAGESLADMHRRVPAVTVAQLSKLMKQPIKAWPRAENVADYAQVLRVDETSVILAFAKSLGLPVQRGVDPAVMAPGLARLTAGQRAVVLSVVDAILTASERAGSEPDDGETDGHEPGETNGSVVGFRPQPVAEPERRVARRTRVPKRRDRDEPHAD